MQQVVHFSYLSSVNLTQASHPTVSLHENLLKKRKR
jgi:hypothetical protein